MIRDLVIIGLVLTLFLILWPFTLTAYLVKEITDKVNPFFGVLNPFLYATLELLFILPLVIFQVILYAEFISLFLG